MSTSFCRTLFAFSWLGPALLLPGCGGSSQASPDAGHDAGHMVVHAEAGPKHDASSGDTSPPRETGTHDVTAPMPEAAQEAAPVDATGIFPAFAPNVPQVTLGSFTGHVIASPVFVPVIFPNDMYQALILTYLTAIGQSDYWKQAVSEYGVGPGTMGAPIYMNETMPSTIDDKTVQLWLANRVGLDPRFGAIPGVDAGAPFDAGSVDAASPLGSVAPNAAPAANVVYVLFFPEGTTVTLGSGVNGGGGKTSSCGQGFGGYHSNFNLSNGKNVTYAMIPRCDTYGALTGSDVLTGATSHELAEASTDPEFQTNPAYNTVDEAHFVWSLALGGGEVGDMCAQFPGAFYHPTEASLSSYIVQRIWSNAAASAGHDPCRPALSTSEVYFNAVPNVGTNDVSINGMGEQMYGSIIPLGQSQKVEIDLFSDGQSAPWQVQPSDYGFQTTGLANLELSLSPMSGSNGQKLELTIKALQTGQYGLSPYLLFNESGNTQNLWIGLVTNQ